MGDLISREAVINLLRELRVDDVAVNGKRITELINELPTAYDVEKVVGELENEMKFWEDSYDYQVGKEKARSYSHAIEIVRKGGVE